MAQPALLRHPAHDALMAHFTSTVNLVCLDGCPSTYFFYSPTVAKKFVLFPDDWAKILFNQSTVMLKPKRTAPSLHIPLCHLRPLGGLAANTLDMPCTHAP